MNTKFDIDEIVYIPVKIDAFQKKSNNQQIQYKASFKDYTASQQYNWFNEEQLIKLDISKETLSIEDLIKTQLQICDVRSILIAMGLRLTQDGKSDHDIERALNILNDIFEKLECQKTKEES